MQPDAIVMRHKASGAPHFLQRFLPTPIINAGDGRHEHPTQALLDAMTILEKKGGLESLRVAIIGDISHSRVARSNIHLLSKFGVDLVLCGPATMVSGSLQTLAPGVTLTNDMNDAVADADVVMMLRVQLERQNAPIFPKNEYFQFFGLEVRHLRLAKPDCLVMPPRTDQSRPRALVGGRRLQELRDSQPGRERPFRADGGAGASLRRRLAAPDQGGRPMSALLIRNGRVVDPASGLDGPARRAHRRRRHRVDRRFRRGA